MVPGATGHCGHRRDVGAALVPCHTAGHGGGCPSCCQCILLPAAASRSSPAAPWGLLTKGTCRSTRCSGAFGDVGSLPRLRPSPNRPLPKRKSWGGRRGRAGRGWQPPRPPPAMREVSTAPLLPASWGNPPSPAPGRDPAPCEMRRHRAAAPSPPPAPHPPLSSRLAPVRRGTPSGAGRVHASTTASLSHAWTDRQTETLPPPGVHLQPGASSCLQLVAAVGGFLYINRAPKFK